MISDRWLDEAISSGVCFHVPARSLRRSWESARDEPRPLAEPICTYVHTVACTFFFLNILVYRRTFYRRTDSRWSRRPCCANWFQATREGVRKEPSPQRTRLSFTFDVRRGICSLTPHPPSSCASEENGPASDSVEGTAGNFGSLPITDGCTREVRLAQERVRFIIIQGGWAP